MLVVTASQGKKHLRVCVCVCSGGNPDVAVCVGSLAVWNVPDPRLI